MSLDSLWALQKLREDGDKGEGESSVFDRDSLRAMPLGLGLQYASLSENQRAQVARRYAPAPGSGAGSALDRSRRRGSTNSPSAAKSTPPSPPTKSTSPPPLSSLSDWNGGEQHQSPSARLLCPPVSPGVELSPGRTPGHRSGFLPRSAELQGVSLSQVDRDVLDCLPSEVREEVLKAIASSAIGSGAGKARNKGVDQSDRGGDIAVSAGNNTSSFGEAPTEDGLGGDFVDLCSPSSSMPPSQRRDPRARGGRRPHGDGVFEVERAATLRGALRAWIGGAVATPSQWHLELLYRWVANAGERQGATSSITTLVHSVLFLFAFVLVVWRAIACEGSLLMERVGTRWVSPSV